MTLRSPRLDALLPVAAVLGAIVSLTVGSSFAKHLFPYVGAEGTSAVRVTFAALLLLAVWRPWRFALSAKAAGAIALYGVVLGLMNLLFYLSLRTIPLGLAISIEFTGPLAVAMLSSRRPLDFVWVGFAVVGLSLLLPIHQGAGHLDPVGMAFALGAGICWALYIVFGQRISHLHPGQTTSLGMLTAALVVLPFGLTHAGTALLDPKLLAAGFAVAVLSSALPYTLEMFALKHLPKQTFGILLSLEPAVGAVAGWIVLAERLTPVQLLAIGCVVVASAGSAMGVRRAAQPAEA